MTYLTQYPVPLLGFAAFSGTGKTTLLEQLIPLLCEKGLSIGLVKHSHHDIEMDKPGKDSYRLRKAGASQVVLAGTQRSIYFHEYEQAHDSKLSEQLQLLQTDKLDLVLVEGFRDEAFPKIELHRASLKKAYLYEQDEHIIALASDQPLTHCSLPQLDINQTSQIVAFIERFISASLGSK